jgi:hypothetical protein
MAQIRSATWRDRHNLLCRRGGSASPVPFLACTGLLDLPSQAGSRQGSDFLVSTCPNDTAAPGPIPIHGAGMAHGMTRKPRRRLRQAS